MTPEDRLGEALKQARLASEADGVPERTAVEIDGAIVELRRARQRLQLAGEEASSE